MLWRSVFEFLLYWSSCRYNLLQRILLSIWSAVPNRTQSSSSGAPIWFGCLNGFRVSISTVFRTHVTWVTQSRSYSRFHFQQTDFHGEREASEGHFCWCTLLLLSRLWDQAMIAVIRSGHMGSVSPGRMKRFFYRTSFWSMRLLPKWLPTFILKLLKLFVTPKLICCSGERGTGERKRGYQAGFSDQVIDLFVLKLNNFNSYIHFCIILQFDLYIQSHSIILLLAKNVQSKSLVIYIYHIYFNLLLTFVELEVASQTVQWN